MCIVVVHIIFTLLYAGREFQAVFLSATEPVHRDGSTRNATRSLSDPYVFNTAVTRARSLVVSVGNPFLLLKMEKRMVQLYGNEHNAHCWSTYLNLCLQHDTLEFGENLMLNGQQRKDYVDKISRSIETLTHDPYKSENLKLKSEVERLTQRLQEHEQKCEIESLKERKPVTIPSVHSDPSVILWVPVNSFADSAALPVVNHTNQSYPCPNTLHPLDLPLSDHGQPVSAASPQSDLSLDLPQHPRSAFNVPPVYPNSPYSVAEMEGRGAKLDYREMTRKFNQVPDMNQSTSGNELLVYL